MNILLNSPNNYQDWNNLNDDIQFKIKKENNIKSENAIDFWKNYYLKKNIFNETYITVYDDIIPENMLHKIDLFCSDGVWKYNYSPYIHPEETEYKVENIPEPIKCFSINVINNIYFKSFFYNIILPKINIENSENILIDRSYIVGQLHGLSTIYHKDERSSIKYGPSIYVFINKLWKPYYDGSLVFILNDEDPTDTEHIENNPGRIIVFPPNMYHKNCEISAYGLVENAFCCILQYHLVYK